MTSFVDALYSRFADPKYSECNSCELFIIGSLSPGKSGKNLFSLIFFIFSHFSFHFPSTFITHSLHLFSSSTNSSQTLTFSNAYSFLLVACKVTNFFFRLLCSRCPLSLHHGMNFIVISFQSTSLLQVLVS